MNKAQQSFKTEQRVYNIYQGLGKILVIFHESNRAFIAWDNMARSWNSLDDLLPVERIDTVKT